MSLAEIQNLLAHLPVAKALKELVSILSAGDVTVPTVLAPKEGNCFSRNGTDPRLVHFLIQAPILTGGDYYTLAFAKQNGSGDYVPCTTTNPPATSPVTQIELTQYYYMHNIPFDGTADGNYQVTVVQHSNGATFGFRRFSVKSAC